MKELSYQLDTLQMGIHFISFAIYLIVIAWRSDRFHKVLKRIRSLNKLNRNKNVRKDEISEDLFKFQGAVKRTKKWSYLLVIILGFIHEIVAWAKITHFGKSYDTWLINQLFIPPICVLISLAILAVIFWLRGRGGGVPYNKYVHGTKIFEDYDM